MLTVKVITMGNKQEEGDSGKSAWEGTLDLFSRAQPVEKSDTEKVITLGDGTKIWLSRYRSPSTGENPDVDYVNVVVHRQDGSEPDISFQLTPLGLDKLTIPHPSITMNIRIANETIPVAGRFIATELDLNNHANFSTLYSQQMPSPQAFRAHAMPLVDWLNRMVDQQKYLPAPVVVTLSGVSSLSQEQTGPARTSGGEGWYKHFPSPAR